MAGRKLGWITLHRVRYDGPRYLEDNRVPAPEGAAVWRFGPDSPLGPSGARTLVSANWGGAGFYETKAEAEAVLADPGAAIATLDDAAEHWTALAQVTAHRGEVNWFEGGDSLAAPEPDPGGPIAVITSAGFNPLQGEALAADLPRRFAFSANVDKVRSFYEAVPGNLVRGIYSFGSREHGRAISDGMTTTLWASDDEMLAAAYRGGVHREKIDWYKAEHSADRTSFTRMRILATRGTWDGANPLAA